MAIYSVILATGSYTSGRTISTEDLVKNTVFYDKEGKVEQVDVEKSKTTIGVNYRLWAHDNEGVDDLGAIALNNCFESSFIKREEIDRIIVARNTGEDIPNISSKIAAKTGFKESIFFDVVCGCQGWCYALDVADALIKSEKARKVAVVGAEILSRIRGRNKDSLLFSDGAGAVILGDFENAYPTGIIASYLNGDPTLNQTLKMSDRWGPINKVDDSDYAVKRDLDMDAYAVYEKAKSVIPETYFQLLKLANIKNEKVKLILKHQASEKILSKSSLAEIQTIDPKLIKYREYLEQYRKDKVPKSLHYLGNNSVATIPLLLDLILKKKVDNPNLEGLLKDLEGYSIKEDDIFAVISVGAGIGWGGQLIKMNPFYWDYLKN